MQTKRKMAKSWLLYLLLILSIDFGPASASLSSANFSASGNPLLRGIELPSFNAVTSDSGCSHHHHRHRGRHDRADFPVDESKAEKPQGPTPTPPLKLQLRRQQAPTGNPDVRETAQKDVLRIQTLFRRIADRTSQNSTSRLARGKKAAGRAGGGDDDCGGGKKREGQPAAAGPGPELAGRLVATLESGVTLGSGEYLMDVFVGTPPRHFSVILDTGSDLNWLQCAPCLACFDQRGPVFDPAASSSFRAVPCSDPRCSLVASPDPSPPCSTSSPCPYFYWYGDYSNTTGDLALETFTVNLTSPNGSSAFRRVDDVIFGCGHWNRGLFHGAAGLLGLGRGPLSFASQLRRLYGGTFSYCLVDRNSDMSVSSKLVFGEDRKLLAHPELNYTAFVAGKDNPADTFYYVRIKGILVGGDMLRIPPETWEFSADGSGGTIVDSGTTLSYFADPAYRVIREAFVERVKNYPMVEDFPVLNPCYNVSGVEKVELPEFAIVFADGAVWNFPVENYFIRLEPEEMVCLAILGTPRSALSIIGNYQQQNFHILYDLDKSRLGFAPMRCAEV